MTTEELKIDLERDYKKHNRQVEDSYERCKATSANKSENKLCFTSIFSILPWVGITGAIAFNMPQIASVIPVEAIPYITLAGSAGIGSIGTRLLYKKNGLTDNLKSFSAAKTDKDLLVEEMKSEIELEQSINRKLIVDKAIDLLEIIDDELPEECDLNVESQLSEEMKKKYEMLDYLSARKVLLREKFADVVSGDKNDMYHVASYMMMGGMISMCYGCMPFIWSNQMMGYGGSPVAVLSPFAVGALGTGAYILKRKKDREDVFYQYYNNYSDDVFDDYSIDDLIIELAKDELQLLKRKLFDEECEDSKVHIKEKKI